ncbi:hypothetical protein [Maribacter sp. 2304DJ31-5]|uniref:hypothetical protein n=1 Tax=Maribacter sp. 2304DJ31-5 TaxID=3386273 RepID=UPI0039BCA429
MVIKQVEWCIANDYAIYDFSKGSLPYKKQWCNQTYNFEHHIFYDSKDIKSKLTAVGLTYLLRFKQYLREHPIRAFITER